MRLNLEPVVAALAALACTACATRSADVRPVQANPGDYLAWNCERLYDEMERVQKRAADVAYAVDERAGNNILALGIGVTVFWPALVAMRPPGAEAEELARLKGKFDAMRVSAQQKRCPPVGDALPAARAATLPVAVGERLVYEERAGTRGPMQELGLRVAALRRGEMEFRVDPAPAKAGSATVWKQDFSGNVTLAPAGSLQWPQLLRNELVLGQVIGGEMWLSDAPAWRARVRGQVVAVGAQTVAGRRFDVAVVELFGDARHGEDSSRLDGVLVVDRLSGLLLRLDLTSAQPGFTLQRRLARVEKPG